VTTGPGRPQMRPDPVQSHGQRRPIDAVTMKHQLDHRIIEQFVKRRLRRNGGVGGNSAKRFHRRPSTMLCDKPGAPDPRRSVRLLFLKMLVPIFNAGTPAFLRSDYQYDPLPEKLPLRPYE
jgi:hypothetical protein